MTSVAFLVDQLFYRAPGGIGTYIGELVPAIAAVDPSIELRLFHARFRRGPGPAKLGNRWLSSFWMEELRQHYRRLYPTWNTVGWPGLPPSLSGLDVLHAPSPGAVPPPGRGQRLVVTVHDLAFRIHPSMFPPAWRTLYRAGLRRTVARADAIVAISRSTANDLSRLTDVDPERVHVVPLAASLPTSGDDPEPVLRRLRIPVPFVLFVGTLEPRKNVVRLVRAYRRGVASSGLPHALVLAGPLGWQAKRLQAELALDAPGTIVPTGPLKSADVDALYRAADAFCYPSLYEGFGLPVLEAMARGVPTITSTASSLPEVAGDAALLVDPRSTEEIAAALRRVLEDAELASSLSKAGRSRATGFTWERTARATVEIYRSLTGA